MHDIINKIHYLFVDYSWIIIASAYAPDFDIVAGELFRKLNLNILIDGSTISHGDLHNIAFLLLFATAAALVLRLAGMRFRGSFLFAGIGFGTCKPKNERCFGQGYRYRRPGEAQRWGIRIVL